MKILFLLLFLLVTSVVTSHSEYNDEYDSLIIAFDEKNYPFMFASNGKASGIYPEIVREVFRRMGYDPMLDVLPWSRAISGVDAGKWGIGGLYMNLDRIYRYDYSDYIYEETLYIWVIPGKEFTFQTIYDLKGKTIGVIRGWSYGDTFDSGVESRLFKVEAVEDDYRNINKLLYGRIDAIVMAQETLESYSSQINDIRKLIKLSTPVATNKTFIAFNKLSNMGELLKKFNYELDAMRKDGSYDTIIKQNYNLTK